jgi:hypothetical protein
VKGLALFELGQDEEPAAEGGVEVGGLLAQLGFESLCLQLGNRTG